MSGTGDDLEDELRALLGRVLSEPLGRLHEELRALDEKLGRLTGWCRELPAVRRTLDTLVPAHEELADASRGLVEGVASLARHTQSGQDAVAEACAAVITQVQEAHQNLVAEQVLERAVRGDLADHVGELGQDMERLRGALAEARAASSARLEQLQQGLVQLRDNLATRSDVQAEALTRAVTGQFDAMALLLDAAQRRGQEQTAAQGEAATVLAQALEQRDVLVRNQINELKWRMRLLTGLGVTAVALLVLAVASTGLMLWTQVIRVGI